MRGSPLCAGVPPPPPHVRLLTAATHASRAVDAEQWMRALRVQRESKQAEAEIPDPAAPPAVTVLRADAVTGAAQPFAFTNPLLRPVPQLRG